MAKWKPIPASEEGWFEIPGYSKHLANRAGEIMTLKTGNSTRGGFAGRYRKVSVYKDGVKEAILTYTHILICTAFYGPPEDDQVVLHKDNDRGNTAAKNLEWGTQSENITDAWKEGLISRESFPPSAKW